MVFLCDTGVQAVHQADLLSDHPTADPPCPQPQDLPRHAQKQAQVRSPPPLLLRPIHFETFNFYR